MEKEATITEIIRNTIDTLLSLLERWKIFLAVLGGTIYVMGYIVTAARLAQYGVSISTLIDPQYFVAGFIPGLLLWFTVFVVISAKYFDPQINEKFWMWTNVLAFILMIILVILPIFSYEVSSKLINVPFYVKLPIAFFFGETCLWIVIVNRMRQKGDIEIVYRKLLLYLPLPWELLKKYFYFEWIRSTWSSLKHFLIFMYSIFLLEIAIITLIFIPFFGSVAYEQIPNAYGGGEPLIVQLFVDNKKVPSELLDGNDNASQSSPTRTVPLNLIFKTSTEYIVDPINDNDRRAWVIRADAVYTAVSMNMTNAIISS